MFPKKDFLTVLFWIIGIIFCFFTVPILFRFFKPVIIGFLISLILYPLTNLLEKKIKFLTKKWSLSLVVIFLLGIFTFLVYLIGSAIGTEIISLCDNFPSIISSLEDDINNIVIYFSSIIDDLQFFNIDLSTFKLPEINNIFDTISNVSVPIVDFGKNLPNFLINFIFTLLFSFFFTLESPNVKKVLEKIIPKDIYKNLFLTIKNIFGGYFLAQFKLLGIMILVIFIGFLIMKIDYALLLSILVGFLDLLPFFGTGTFLGPFGIICFFKGDYDLVLGCIIIYLITFTLRRILEPKLIGDSIGISSFFSLFCMFIGFRIMGIIGFILGVPIGVILLYLFKLGAFKSFMNSCKNIFLYFKSLINLE